MGPKDSSPAHSVREHASAALVLTAIRGPCWLVAHRGSRAGRQLHEGTLEEGESFTTLELKINFLKPVWKARLKATGRVVKQGRTIGLIECDVIDEQGSLVARAVSTCMILRGEQATGR